MVEETGGLGVKAPIGTEASEGALAAGLAVAVEIMPVPEAPAPDPATRQAKEVAPKWPPFALGSVTYSFDHLVDFAFTCRDSEGAERSVLVTFSDHVFTRKSEPGDLPGDAFPGCSRTPDGYVCQTRYRMSFQLPGLIERVAAQRVWLLTGDDRYAQIPVLDDEGKKLLYAVIFSLERNKGREHPLRMYVRSAHLYDRKPPDTFGEVKFAHLVRLRIANKHPPKNHDRGRKRPKMP